MTGKLCAQVTVGAHTVQSCPAAFVVTSVTERSSTATITKGLAASVDGAHAAVFREALERQRRPAGDTGTQRKSHARPASPPAPEAAASPARNATDIRWIGIPPGSFLFGCQPGDLDCEDDERPPRRVQITRPFSLAETETTVAQWALCVSAGGCGELPRHAGEKDAGAPDLPVTNVSWYEALQLCRWAGGRLPTEAEWEYAARGSVPTGRFPWGESASHDESNFDGSAGRDRFEGSSPVRSFRANTLGLSDMAGNVWEWVADVYAPHASADPSASDPAGPSSGPFRVQKGGGFASPSRSLRISERAFAPPDARAESTGFRCARDGAAP